MRKAQDRQKNYADKRRKNLESEIRDNVLLKVTPMKGVLRFVRGVSSDQDILVLLKF